SLCVSTNACACSAHAVLVPGFRLSLPRIAANLPATRWAASEAPGFGVSVGAGVEASLEAELTPTCVCMVLRFLFVLVFVLVFVVSRSLFDADTVVLRSLFSRTFFSQRVCIAFFPSFERFMASFHSSSRRGLYNLPS